MDKLNKATSLEIRKCLFIKSCHNKNTCQRTGMTMDAQCTTCRHVKLINANDFFSVHTFFQLIWKSYRHPYIPKKVGRFGITSLRPHSTIRSHSSHSEPHFQPTKLWSLPLRKPVKNQPLLEAAQDLAYRLLKT